MALRHRVAVVVFLLVCELTSSANTALRDTPAMAWYDEPKYNRTLSSAGYLLFCLMYVVASVLPFLMLAFAAGVALGLFSGRVLLVMARADMSAPAPP